MIIRYFSLQVFVRCCVRNAVNILTGNVNVIPVGRGKNVHCDMMNVRCQTATVTVIASAVNVNACAATRENSVKTVCNYKIVMIFFFIFNPF